MNNSLNEIESLSKKAARGAGLSWGLAEEVGKAARWLSSHQADGLAVLAAQLQEDERCHYAQLAPRVAEDVWQSSGHWMCPLVAGTTLCDHAYLLRSGVTLKLADVVNPQLLQPYVSATARQLGQTLALSWDNCMVLFNRLGAAFVQQADCLAAPRAALVQCSLWTGSEELGLPQPHLAADLSDLVRSTLEQLAAHTYVPASEVSRLQGAGAGLSDNN